MKRIIFEDHGQDFLEWVIDETNTVVECEPAQGFVWNQSVVLTMEVGEQPEIQTWTGLKFTLAYPIVEIVDL